MPPKVPTQEGLDCGINVLLYHKIIQNRFQIDKGVTDLDEGTKSLAEKLLHGAREEVREHRGELRNSMYKW